MEFEGSEAEAEPEKEGFKQGFWVCCGRISLGFARKLSAAWEDTKRNEVTDKKL
jgi:hypothetical protein